MLACVLQCIVYCSIATYACVCIAGDVKYKSSREGPKLRLLQCIYEPLEVGLYVIMIKWEGEEVARSPIKVYIFDTFDELSKSVHSLFPAFNLLTSSFLILKLCSVALFFNHVLWNCLCNCLVVLDYVFHIFSLINMRFWLMEEILAGSLALEVRSKALCGQ